jgi:mannose-6-phosphate isomerase-like protein (cupin superfamily)
MTDYYHATVDEFDTNPEKPGQRWELSPELGVDAYNFNVAVLDSGDPLSQNGYHYHESQAELFYVVDGRCRVEVDAGGFTLETDDVVYFEAGVVHLLHNPFDDPCKVVAIGSPPEGRYPVHQVAAADELLDRRYGDPSPTAEAIDDAGDTT